jgi:hypothetical protein
VLHAKKYKCQETYTINTSINTLKAHKEVTLIRQSYAFGVKNSFVNLLGLVWNVIYNVILNSFFSLFFAT